MREVEKEIDIWDMFLYMCQKWRVLIGAAVIFMVLFGALGAYKNMNSGTKEQSFDSEVSLGNLSLVDQNRVQHYLLADEMYQNALEQNEKDELLLLDYSNIYSANVDYIIEENDDSVAIAKVLEDKIKAAWNYKTDINQFNEVSLGYDSSVSIYDGVGNKQSKSVVVSVNVYGIDDEGCQSSLESVDEIVKAAEKELKNVFGQYQTKFIEGESYVTSLDKLQNYINDKKNFEYTRLNNKVNISAALSETAKQYIEEYQKADEDTEEVEENEGNEKKSPISLINVKFILLGLVGGGIFAAAIYCVIYILNGKVRYEDDLEQDYGLNLLGRVSGEQKGIKLDQWLLNLRRRNIHHFTYQECVEIIASEIKVKAQRSGIQKVYATGCMMGEKQNSLVKDVAKVLADAKIELICGKSILYYAEALEESSAVGSILLFEKCNEARYVEIEQEMRRAEARGLDIVGMVLVE